MLCSARELGISDDHEGIYLLPKSASLGVDVKTIFGKGDVIFDIAVTPNRADALSAYRNRAGNIRSQPANR